MARFLCRISVCSRISLKRALGVNCVNTGASLHTHVQFNLFRLFPCWMSPGWICLHCCNCSRTVISRFTVAASRTHLCRSMGKKVRQGCTFSSLDSCRGQRKFPGEFALRCSFSSFLLFLHLSNYSFISLSVPSSL